MTDQIILLEDDENLKRVLSRALSSAGFQIRATASDETALGWLRAGQGDLLLADILLDGTNFLEKLGLVHRLRPDLPVIVMSAQATARTAIDAEKRGVFDYLPKPFDLEDMIAVVREALGQRAARPVRSPDTAQREGFVGQSEAIQETFKNIARAANSRAHVVILGETGVGKRQAANAVVKERGLDASAAGALTASHSVTEIFEAPRTHQTLLWLRLDEWSAEQQVAARNALDAAEVQIIATLTEPLSAGVDRRLIERLSECVVTIPPLRERSSDIPTLADYFLEQFARRDDSAKIALTKKGAEFLQSQDWPGNVMQLRSVLSRMALEVRGKVADRADLERIIAREVGPVVGRAPDADDGDDGAVRLAASALQGPNARQSAVDALDRALFEQAMSKAQGNRSRAATLLGVNRNTLARRLSELGLDADA